MKQSNTLSHPWIVCLLAVFACMLWGSAFPTIKLGYEYFQIPSSQTGSVLLFAGLRFTLAGILTILFGSFFSKKLLVPKKESWFIILKLCLLQTVAQYIFFYIGLANTSGVKSSIINASNTFMAILIPALFFKLEKLTKNKIFGCLVGFIGVILINLNGTSIDMTMKLTGEGFIFLSAVSYALASVYIKKYSNSESPVILSGYQFLFGGILLMIFGFLGNGRIETINVPGIIVILHLSLVSAVAYTIWAILLKHNPVSKVSIYGFMTPVCGVLLSAVLLSETSQAFGITGFISLIFVCAGIYLVNKA